MTGASASQLARGWSRRQRLATGSVFSPTDQSRLWKTRGTRLGSLARASAVAKTIEQILGYISLGATIKAVIDGVPDPLPPGFRAGDDYLGDSVRYPQISSTRQTAKRVQYGSPALRRALRNIEERDAKFLHSFEEIQFSPLLLQKLRDYENYTVQRMGMTEVTRQVEEFTRVFYNLETTAILQVLFSAAIYFDASGNLLPSSSGAVESVTFGISANNQNQLNGIIAASWATATTDIPLHIRQIKKTARRSTGYPIKNAFYGENIPSYLQKNDFVKDWFVRNPAKNEAFLNTGELPRGMLGVENWIPAYETFFEDQNAANQNIIGVDAVVFTPDPSLDWWEVAKGSYQVPSSLDVAPTMAAVLGNLQTVYGMFAYAVPSDNPPSAIMRQGHTFLPILKVPNAIFQADVTP